MSDVEFDFSNEIQRGRWELIEPHFKKETVFRVIKPLDLQTVGHCLARDQVNILKIWLDNKEVIKLEEDNLGDYVNTPTQDFCDFLIVQPFILIQY